jgi:poly(A) polymerase
VLLRGAGVDTAAVEQTASRLRLSARDRERLEALVRLPLPDPRADGRAHRYGIYAHGSARYLDLLRLAVALNGGDPSSVHAVEALATEWRAPEFPLDGNDLQSRGIPPGPQLGALLRHVRHWWETRDFAPDRAACLARLDALLAPESGS